MQPIEHWTSDQFVPFSPRHALQPETDLLLQFLDYSTSQQAVNFHSVDVGHYMSSQRNTDELEHIANAICMVLEDLQSSPAVNTCASCNATVNVEDEGSEDISSSVDTVSDSECDCDTETKADSSLDIDCSTSHEQTSHCNLDPLHDQTNSAFKTLVVEDWLADNSVSNINNACLPRLTKSGKEKHDANAQTASKKHAKKVKTEVPVSKNPPADSDSKSVCAQHMPASVSHHQPEDTQVKHQSPKSKICCPRQNTLQGKSQNLNSSSKESLAKSWQVQNVSKQCSLFEHKKEILNQPIPVYQGFALKQVNLLVFSLLHIYLVYFCLVIIICLLLKEYQFCNCIIATQ